MNQKSHLKGIALRTLIVLVAMALVAGVVMLSLPESILAGGGNFTVALGSLVTLGEQGTHFLAFFSAPSIMI